MIDLHMHILPGIDDGPADLAAAVSLADAAANAGVRVVAATPHVHDDFPAVNPDELATRCVGLAETLRSVGIRLKLVPAGEVDLLWAQRASDDALRLVSYGQNGTDLLLETPHGPLPPGFDALVLRIHRERGYRVLLAHPERNPTFQRNPERLAALVSGGTAVQVVAGSLMHDDRRSPVRRLATALIEEGLAHVLASDAHSAGPWRPPNLDEGVRLASTIDPARAEWMATDAPAAILEGAPLGAAPAGAPPRGRIARALRRLS